jgi:hypothetical protein
MRSVRFDEFGGDTRLARLDIFVSPRVHQDASNTVKTVAILGATPRQDLVKRATFSLTVMFRVSQTSSKVTGNDLDLRNDHQFLLPTRPP